MNLFKKKDNVNDNNKDNDGNNKKVTSGKIFPYIPPKSVNDQNSNGKKIKGFKWL